MTEVKALCTLLIFKKKIKCLQVILTVKNYIDLAPVQLAAVFSVSLNTNLQTLADRRTVCRLYLNQTFEHGRWLMPIIPKIPKIIVINEINALKPFRLFHLN